MICCIVCNKPVADCPGHSNAEIAARATVGFRVTLGDALAAATGTAKTAKQAECEASQSGPNDSDGNAQ